MCVVSVYVCVFACVCILCVCGGGGGGEGFFLTVEMFSSPDVEVFMGPSLSTFDSTLS